MCTKSDQMCSVPQLLPPHSLSPLKVHNSSSSSSDLYKVAHNSNCDLNKAGDPNKEIGRISSDLRILKKLSPCSTMASTT